MGAARTFRERHGSHENALFFLVLTSEGGPTGAMSCAGCGKGFNPERFQVSGLLVVAVMGQGIERLMLEPVGALHCCLATVTISTSLAVALKTILLECPFIRVLAHYIR